MIPYFYISISYLISSPRTRPHPPAPHPKTCPSTHNHPLYPISLFADDLVALCVSLSIYVYSLYTMSYSICIRPGLVLRTRREHRYYAFSSAWGRTLTALYIHITDGVRGGASCQHLKCIAGRAEGGALTDWGPYWSQLRGTRRRWQDSSGAVLDSVLTKHLARGSAGVCPS